MSSQAKTHPGRTLLHFWDFFSKFYLPVRGIELPLREHHRQICETLEDIALGNSKERICIINMPPRTGKSIIAKALCCWQYYLFCDSQIIYASYVLDLAMKACTDVRDFCLTKEMVKLNNGKPILGAIRQASKFETTQGGAFNACGVNGQIIGFGAGLKRKAGGFIVIDDPSDPMDFQNMRNIAQLAEWFEGTLYSRLNSEALTPIIVVAQRLNVDDLCGYLLRTRGQKVKLIKFPAVVNGVNQIPETLTSEGIKDKCSTPIGRQIFEAMYQQEPMVRGGNVVRMDDLKRFDPRNPPPYEKLLITVDTAMRAKECNDRTAWTLWGKYDGRMHLQDLEAGRWEFGKVVERMVRFYRNARSRFPAVPLQIHIEAKAHGIALEQELKKLSIPSLPVQRFHDKVVRLNAVLPFVEAGLCVIPEESTHPNLGEFLAELMSFSRTGKNLHDDYVDCFIDGLNLGLTGTPCILDVLG